MQIEAGKYYKTRDGRKVGPVEHYSAFNGWRGWKSEGVIWQKNGTHGDGDDSINGQAVANRPGDDLIAEWVEPTATPAPTGPVRMVRQIVPGVYGRVEVSPYAGTSVTHVGVRLEPMSDGYAALNADELRSAAMVFSQLAEALDDQP